MATKKLGLVSIKEEKPMAIEIVGSLSDGEVMDPPTKRIKSDTAGRSCQFCSNKKQVAAGCLIQACKRCCLAREAVCLTHPKEVKKTESTISEFKKRVLKNEFRESNFHLLADYGETVTIFCVQDFYKIKKLSQGVLNDQGRAERVSGSMWGRPTKQKTVDVKVKALIEAALGKRPLPKGYADNVRTKLAVPEAYIG